MPLAPATYWNQVLRNSFQEDFRKCHFRCSPISPSHLLIPGTGPAAWVGLWKPYSIISLHRREEAIHMTVDSISLLSSSSNQNCAALFGFGFNFAQTNRSTFMISTLRTLFLRKKKIGRGNFTAAPCYDWQGSVKKYEKWNCRNQGEKSLINFILKRKGEVNCYWIFTWS